MAGLIDDNLLISDPILRLRSAHRYRAIVSYIKSLTWAEHWKENRFHYKGMLRVFMATPAVARQLEEVGLWEQQGDEWLIVHPDLPAFIEAHRKNQRSESIVYLIREGDDGPVKVGKSCSPRTRLAELQTSHHRPLTLLGVLPGVIERELHEFLSEYRVHGEWFDLPENVISDLLEVA